jgi:hypothetical protein
VSVTIDPAVEDTFAHAAHVLTRRLVLLHHLLMLGEESSGLAVGRGVRVRVRQQGLNLHQDRGAVIGWRPGFVKDVKANFAI